MNNIYDEIKNERNYQITKWGTNADDQINTPMDFVGYISHHSTRWFNGGFRPYSQQTLLKFRSEMVKVASLAVAAIEYTDKLLSKENMRDDVLKNENE